MPVATATARLKARISTDLHSMLKRAAELQGRTMTDFVVSAVQEAAQRAIARNARQPIAYVFSVFRHDPNEFQSVPPPLRLSPEKAPLFPS